MQIARLNERITFQKNVAIVDRYRNHTSIWTDYFSCWATATASGKSAEESAEAGVIQEADRLDFTLRYSSETAAINSKQFRVILGERIYDIVNIDEMGFRHHSRKLKTILRAR